MLGAPLKYFRALWPEIIKGVVIFNITFTSELIDLYRVDRFILAKNVVVKNFSKFILSKMMTLNRGWRVTKL